ncbi:MAG TPA: efflux RND transporter periplasmic adaptor subunit [Gemmatimonadaceae bacterium]|nr:efflux RND transporter periplasmic adaptor subunit [Gemmatimonadaceae bacterium]
MGALGSALTACGKTQAPKNKPPVPVAIATAHRAAVPVVLPANGIVEPIQTAQVSSQVDGIIKHVNFHEGQDVEQGQVMFEIDPTQYRAAYNQARATLAKDIATKAYDSAEAVRYAQLVVKDYVTKEQAGQFEATYLSQVAVVAADSAAVATAKFNLDNSTIRAPISGRTGNLLVREGNLVHGTAGTSLVLINQIHPIYVQFYLPATSLPDIQKYSTQNKLTVTVYQSTTQPNSPAPATANDPPGDASRGTPVAPSNSGPTASNGPPSGSSGRRRRTADTSGAPSADSTTNLNPGLGGGPPGGDVTGVSTAATPAGPGIDGTLTFINNAVDTATGTVLLKATFPNQSSTLWPGEFVSANLHLYTQQNALVVPAAAIMTGQQGVYVFVVDPKASTVSQRSVIVGRQTTNAAVINSGLAEGERVVTDGQSRLQNGMKVNVRALATATRSASTGSVQ